MPEISQLASGIQEFKENLLGVYSKTDANLDQQRIVVGEFLVDMASMLSDVYVMLALNSLYESSEEEREIAEKCLIYYQIALSREPATELSW